ncbi:MAG: hypothetical protein ACLQPN_09810 [Bryobacteraceae bacterium]
MSIATLGIEMLVPYTVPLVIGVKQFDVDDENARAIPPKFPGIVTVAVSVLNRVFGNPLGPRIGTVWVAASTSCGEIAIALRTAVRESPVPPVPNSVPLDGGVSSINCIAPTNTAVAPTSLANALNDKGDASVPIDCIVTGKALATGVTVSRAVAPWTVKLANEMVWPEVKSDVATVNVADCAPTPPLESVNVEVPEVVSEGADPNVNPEGKVTVKLDPIASVVVAV